ncbi:hypothetical protein Ddc_10872 [Ditylenchus destructor]|nr:hypothetical protein Ddc_10872 [Ditylenchus destructor]
MVRLLPMTTYSILVITICSTLVVDAKLYCQSDEDCSLYFQGGICIVRGSSGVGTCALTSAVDSAYKHGVRQNRNGNDRPPTACYLCDTLPFCGVNPYCKIVGCC